MNKFKLFFDKITVTFKSKFLGRYCHLSNLFRYCISLRDII